MARYAPVIIVVLLMIYCVVDVAQSERYEVRFLPKWAWFVVIACLPLIGSLAWLVFGRPRSEPGGDGGSRRYSAPDDDPDFLRNL